MAALADRGYAVLLDLFLIGLVVTLEPIPLTAMILLLAAERGISQGPGVHARVAVHAGGHRRRDGAAHRWQAADPQSAPSTAALCVKLAVGVVLVFIGYRRWGKRATTEPKRQPKWMAGIDRINPLAAAGLGFLLQPWVLVAAGVATITEAKLSSGLEYLAVFAFCIWCTASYLVLEIYAALRPAGGQDQAQRAARMDHHAPGPGDRVPVVGARVCISSPRASTAW